MKFLFFLAWVTKHTLGIHNLCELLVAKLFVDPGVGYSYTRIYRSCTCGCTNCVHPGGDEICSPAN